VITLCIECAVASYLIAEGKLSWVDVVVSLRRFKLFSFINYLNNTAMLFLAVLGSLAAYSTAVFNSLYVLIVYLFYCVKQDIRYLLLLYCVLRNSRNSA